jgi:hypothetical protein
MGAITAGGILQGSGDNLLHFTDSKRPSADPQGTARDRQLNTHFDREISIVSPDYMLIFTNLK